MGKVKLLITATLGLILIYGIAWICITYSICQHLNREFAGKANRIFGFQEDDYKISFFKATPDGFPFKLGAKIYNLSEESLSGLITHKEPVSTGYDLLSQKFYLKYSGESLVRPKPLEAGFGTKITGEYSHSISYSISPKIITIFKNPGRAFELINFIKYFEFSAKDVKAHDIIDKSLLFDEDYISAKLEISDKPYYNSMDELRSAPPVTWHLTSKSKITKTSQNKRIALASLVYGILHSSALTHDIDIKLTTKAKLLNVTEIVKNSELKTKHWSYSDDNEDYVGSLNYLSKCDDDKIDIDLKYDATLTPKANFLKQKIEDLKKIAREVINMEGITLLKPVLNAFLEDPQRFLPTKVDAKKLSTKLDFNLQGVDNKMNFNLEDFSLYADDVGFSLQNISNIDNLFGWNSAGMITLIKYKNSVNYITDYVEQIKDKKDSEQLVALNKDVRSEFLRLISNHPESISDDLVLNYEFSSDSSAGKIGALNMADVFNLYYTTLYKQAIKAANTSLDFNKTLEEFAPELLSNPELLEKMRQ